MAARRAKRIAEKVADELLGVPVDRKVLILMSAVESIRQLATAVEKMAEEMRRHNARRRKKR